MKKSIFILFVALFSGVQLFAGNDLKIYGSDGNVFRNLSSVTNINELLALNPDVKVISCTIVIDGRGVKYTSASMANKNLNEFLNRQFPADQSQGKSLVVTNVVAEKAGTPLTVADVTYKVGF